MHKTFGQVMIFYASALHICWGIVSLIDSSAFHSTALSGVFNIFGRATPEALFVVGCMALIALRIDMKALNRLFLMAPQQGVLMMSAYTAALSVWLGMYADGVVRPWEFILADQMPALLAAIFYSFAIIINGFPEPLK